MLCDVSFPYIIRRKGRKEKGKDARFPAFPRGYGLGSLGRERNGKGMEGERPSHGGMGERREEKGPHKRFT